MDFSQLAALAGGHAEARAIQTALKLGLFESVAHGRCDADALAASLKADRRAVGVLADALTALDLLAKTGKQYDLADIARRFLIKSSAEYLGDLILFDEALFETWAHLEQTIRTGAPARTPDMFQVKPDETERFIRAMDSLTRARGDATYVAERLDLSEFPIIADLGGGPGTYVAAMLRRWPHLRAAIFDLPATLEVARQIIAEREPDLAPRIDLIPLNYRKVELPGRCSAIFMSNIIHSEDEATNADLMRKCFRALNSGGIAVVKDHIMNEELTEPKAGAIFSLYLLLTTRGRDYSFSEVSGWLRGAGFIDIRLESLPSPPFTSSMVIARKP
ncbi:MAG: methyltransferase [Candidatus Binatus sp.]|uniref:methyltransferase n=1 Tax=Candidatus Binatus sp. TaxID=2811406 RepID=UPI0027289D8F|nr:methyltransferase [Candidatus Binatus sp.]MDO8433081.1 methyltransferase [Candidatus Binatus sp.]